MEVRIAHSQKMEEWTHTGREGGGVSDNASRNGVVVVVDVCTEGRCEGGGVGKMAREVVGGCRRKEFIN